MENFDIPIALIFFNRPQYLKKLMEVIVVLKPSKLYLISDGARLNIPGEKEKVDECRKLVEESITWQCDVKKNYADINKGCYDRIANGASWVFEQEDMAIFLEDDNIPELTFFNYCKENLIRYQNEEKVFWICGGNYLVNYNNNNKSGSYIFSQQMFPCGWASWKRAWKYYDGSLKKFDDKILVQKVLSNIKDKKIRNYKKIVWSRLYNEFLNEERPYTWDHQWHFSLLCNNAYGIVPKFNQITNIGIGEDSTHGGVKMTEHLEGIVMLESIPIEFPMSHPAIIEHDVDFDRLIDQRIKGVPTYKYVLSKIKKKLCSAQGGKR